MKENIRVRFAPSPTGPLHIGGVRTALYNYLFARQSGGTLILRIEDTDQGRFVPGAEDYITESLAWCGVTFDESPATGGPYGPYRQSERKEHYLPFAEQLLREGNAYYAFDTPEELESMRKAAGKSTFQYDAGTRMGMRNSLSLPDEEVQSMLQSGHPFVIRMKMPENEEVLLHDMIRGEVRVSTHTLDDKVLFKSDGMPTYHLANVVDDHLMEISHVIRGEEWLPSAPLHVLLYRFLGWEESMPLFAHLPLLLKPDGNGKLSKRDGDKLGFPVFPLHWTDPVSGDISSGYREAGYLPDAFINFLAFLGWNPGTEQEIFSMDELVQAFSLERVQKAGARFDFEKAKWFNQQYIKAAPVSILTAVLAQQTEEKGISASADFLEKACDLVRERIVFLNDLWEASSFLFCDPQDYETEALKKKWKPESAGILNDFSHILEPLDFTNPQTLDSAFHAFIESRQLGAGAVLAPLRLAITGKAGGPGMFEIMSLIGKETTLRRLNHLPKTL